MRGLVTGVGMLFSLVLRRCDFLAGSVAESLAEALAGSLAESNLSRTRCRAIFHDWRAVFRKILNHYRDTLGLVR